MERLTEWKDDKKLLAKAKFSGDFGSANVLCRLAEYEDLEEQGLLLRSQCRVGDIVYSINHNEKHGVTPVVVVEVKFGATGLTNKPYIKLICSDSDLRTKVRKEYDGNDFGKTVFLTKEEAENRLKEMESD